MQEQEALRLLTAYRETMRQLEKRREELAVSAGRPVKRLELLDQEISEMAEVIGALRRYAQPVS